VQGGSVTLQGLRLVVDATQAKITMAALKVKGGGKAKVEKCEFVQVNPPGTGQGRLSSVVVEGSDPALGNPKLHLNDCYFLGGNREAETPDSSALTLGGQDAVTV